MKKLPRMKMRSGFTLLELLVVTTILTILVVLVVPGVVNTKARRLVDESERLLLLLNLARQESMMRSQVWRVEFSPEDKSYSFYVVENDEVIRITRSPFTGVILQKASTGKN